MSFLPLAGMGHGNDHGAMHPYVVDRMVRERQEELARQAHADRSVRAACRTAAGVPAWRRGAGRALMALAVAVAVPRSRRRTTRRAVVSALGPAPPC